MNLQLLIDSIVRQTTVLIAQLATLHDVRAPLAHVANQVFLDLANELFAQGVSRKVSADMFGMALRTYLRKIQRLSESGTDHSHSLWEAVLGYLNEHEVVSRTDILLRFHRDEGELVRGVLHDLCESGLVFRSGSGAGTVYRAARPEELRSLNSAEVEAGLEELVWAIIYREGPLSLEELRKRAFLRQLEPVLARLIAQQRVQELGPETSRSYRAQSFYVPRDASIGWEAAVLDHFQALVKTIVRRLAIGSDEGDERIGGSTYSFEVWKGHPLEAEALGQLTSFRDKTSDLRTRIRAYNDQHARPSEYYSVTVYAGQCVVAEQNTSECEVPRAGATDVSK